MSTLKQSNISILPELSDFRYENIFNVYKTPDDGRYYYNINTTVTIPDDIDQNTCYLMTVNGKSPWTTISYRAYKTIELWWLLVILNKITNPLTPPNGVIKILKPEYVRPLITEMHNSL